MNGFTVLCFDVNKTLVFEHIDKQLQDKHLIPRPDQPHVCFEGTAERLPSPSDDVRVEVERLLGHVMLV